MEQMTDAELKKLLQQIVNKAIRKSADKSRNLEVHHVGMTHAKNKFKHGWYVFIQNFDKLTVAKRGDESNTRLNFRIMSFSDVAKEPVFQVLVWHPSIGNQTESERKIIFEEKVKGSKRAFTQFMTTAINLTCK